VVTREEIRQKLWPGNTFVDFDHSLNAAVNKLREALGDSAEAPRYIETLPRRGYRFIARVEAPEAPNLTVFPVATTSEPAAGPPPQSAVAPPAAAPRQSRRPLLFAGAAAAVGLLLLLIAGQARRRSAGTGPAPEIRSVAVLPFENMSRDLEQEYFADGMTEAVISRLSQVGALHVISRTSVMRYRGARKPLPEIGRELNVEGIVEGAVQRSGDRVRISAKLIQANTDHNVWAGTYERDLRDVLQLQAEVASAIAEEIRVVVTPEERSRLTRAWTVNTEAYPHYLKGRHFQATWSSAKAAEEFRASVRADPKHALSWAGLAEAELYGYPPRETMPRGKQAALRALELDPELPEGHAMLGLARTFWDWDWDGAEESFARAILLDPRSAEIRHLHSHLLAARGRVKEAIAESRRALALDPLSPNVSHYLGRLYYFDRDYASAERELRRAVELDPRNYWAHLFLGVVYEAAGRHADAVKHRARSAVLNGADPEIVGRFRDAFARDGYETVRRRMLEWESTLTQMPLGSSALALGWARLGEREKALEWLEKAFESHTRDLIYLKVEPSYDSLRGDPRFLAMLRRLGLEA
jgi:TolB-like protein/DNA-binding winged helix-turn-helix (wHTH) protein/Flp pilus assembly protein TadD